MTEKLRSRAYSQCESDRAGAQVGVMDLVFDSLWINVKKAVWPFFNKCDLSALVVGVLSGTSTSLPNHPGPHWGPALMRQATPRCGEVAVA